MIGQGRKKRILWATAFLVIVAGGSAWIALNHARGGAAKPYRPGEVNEEITRALAPPYDTGKTPAAKIPSSSAVPHTADDGLRNIDQRLPAGAPAPRFVDVTARAGLSQFRTFQGIRTSQLPEDMGSGAAWGDFDNDGFEDLFLVSAGGPLDAPVENLASSMLFRNQGDGTFKLVEDFPDLRIHGMAAAWGDYDNDGWLDLIVTGYDTLMLFRNDHGRLVRDKRFPEPKGFWAGASWGDYDGDGNLDVYICGYVKYTANASAAKKLSLQFGLEVPYTLNPSSFAAERNLLFHNKGDGTFSEVAAQLGVDDVGGRSLSALWHDFDNDGSLDLYVANDISENKLYLNHQGKFIDSGDQAWVAEYRGSMGLTVGDWDGDGDDDLFITHWIAEEDALYNSLISEQKAAAAKPGGKAAGGLHFMDMAEAAGIGQLSLQYIGWGTQFADFDNDGWLDLAVANGSTFQIQENPRQLKPMDAFFLWNNHGKSFYNLAPWNRSLSEPHVSRGLAIADYDNDGALDLLIVDRDGGVRLLQNRMATGNWLELRLRNRAAKAGQPLGFGDGCTVVARAGNRDIRRSVSNASYLSQSSRTVHLGLGQADQIERIEVHWPGGNVESYSGLEINSSYELRQGDPVAHRLNPAKTPRLITQRSPGAGGPLSREQMLEFWATQREAMDVMKKQGDLSRAAVLFRRALSLNPEHEDSRYYLAHCLAAQGDEKGALEQLNLLVKINPHSHRGFQQRGLLLAASAKSREGLSQAEKSLEQARSLNPEETGTMLILGEVALAMGNVGTAEQRLRWVCASNPRAAEAYFLRGFIEWKNGKDNQAREMLVRARAAMGREWKPKGSVLEGEVHQKMHEEAAFLSLYWDRWDGSPDPSRAFGQLNTFLAAQRELR